MLSLSAISVGQRSCLDTVQDTLQLRGMSSRDDIIIVFYIIRLVTLEGIAYK